MSDKAPDAYRTISEVAEDLDLPQHVLRFWETRFSQIRPLKRGGGRRYYRPDDVELLKGIRYLLYSEGYTIKGVQRILKEQGPKAVQALVHGPAGAAMVSDPPMPASIVPLPEPEDFEDDSEETFAAPAPVRAPEVALPQPQVRPPPAPPPATRPEPIDLFAPLDLPPPPPAPPPQVAPPPAPPPVPVRSPVVADPPPPARPNVSFMRGGVKPIVAAGAEPTPPVFPRRPPPPIADEAPPPQPEVRETARPAPVLPAPEALPAGVRLSDSQRRDLQSALFELSECRRAIEGISASRGR